MIHYPAMKHVNWFIFSFFLCLILTTTLCSAAEMNQMEDIQELNAEIFGNVPANMNDPGFWFEYGVKSLLIGEDEKALVAFANVVDLDPGNAAAWSYLGKIFNKMGLSDAGQTSIETSQEIDPNIGDLYHKKVGNLADLAYTPVPTPRPEDENKEPFETEETLDVSKHTDPLGPELIIDTIKAVIDLSKNTIKTETEISNSGKADSGSFYVTYYLSPDKSITTDDYAIGFRFFENIPIGERESFVGSLKIPRVEPGDYYIGIIVDPENSVMEVSEDNNAKSTDTPLPIPGFNEWLQAVEEQYDPLAVEKTYTESISGPDLIVFDMSNPYIASAGGTLNIQTSIRNQGSEPAKASSVNIYISDDLIFDESDQLIGSGTVDPLSPGMQSDGNALLELPKTLKKGVYYLGVVVDEEGTVTESIEDNNIKFSNRIIVKQYFG